MSWNGGGRGGYGGGGWRGGYGQPEEPSPPEPESTSSPPPATPTSTSQPTTSSTSTSTAPNSTPDTSVITSSLLVTTTLSQSGTSHAETEVSTNVITSYSTLSTHSSPPSRPSSISNPDPAPLSPASDDDASETVTVLVTESADPATESVFVSDEPEPQGNLGPIIGGIVGGVLALILLIALLLCLRRRRRMVASQDSRSATPTPFFANRILANAQSDESSLSLPGTKRPCTPDSEVRVQDPFYLPTVDSQPMQETLYVVVDPTTLMPQGSAGPLRVSSPGGSTSSLEHYTFSQGWNRVNPCSPQDDLPCSPHGTTLSPMSITIPQEHGSRDAPTTLTLVPISHLGHGYGNNDEPPPEYRHSRS